MTSKRPRAAFEADLQTQQPPYAFYGTPLPPLDAGTRDDGSYVPIWKQEVTDERGRKRFHGAFTGGFSAGYFNTVGSKEGWTPATFVSSRQNRAKDAEQQFQQRIEDFMDEDDLREAEESRKLQTVDDFAGFGSLEADASRRAGFMDILRIDEETMGMKLLKKMGWREGQGIGRKVRRRANVGDDTGDVVDDKTYLFAPDNPPMVSFVHKTDHKGLGYEGEARLRMPNDRFFTNSEEEGSDSFFGQRLALKDRSKPFKESERKRGGFGVGVLNDTGSDDEDPFSLGPRISYNRVIGGSKKKKTQAKPVSDAQPTTTISNPLLSSKPVFLSRKEITARRTAGFRKCHDGRFPLDGFVLADELSSLSLSSGEKRYAPPEIPKGWKSAKIPLKERNTIQYISTAEAAKASTLDPISRAALLGEAQLPERSIFDWMTPEAREKIVRLTGKTDLPPALGQKAPLGYETSQVQKRKDLWDLVPKLDKQLAVQALNRAVSGWMPYSEDESKRARYKAFLEVRAGIRGSLPDRAPGSSTDEWVTELNEFARAAEVFKPMSGLMASRFTSASSAPKVASDAPDTLSTADFLLTKPVHIPEDPAVAAAKIGMFGHLTRNTLPFYPSRLLCKRFNVKPPMHVQLDLGEHVGGETSSNARFAYPSGPGPKELVSRDVMNELMLESGRGVTQVSRPDQSKLEPSSSLQSRMKVAIEPERNEALEAKRPGEAVFKAIFGTDDEDDEETI